MTNEKDALEEAEVIEILVGLDFKDLIEIVYLHDDQFRSRAAVKRYYMKRPEIVAQVWYLYRTGSETAIKWVTKRRNV